MTDLYLKGIKEYKAPATKASDSEGQVKKWSTPAAPKAPEFSGDVSSELSAYESETVGGDAAASGTGAASDEGSWFELGIFPSLGLDLC